MSIMDVKEALITLSNAALTAMFGEYSLGFVKHLMSSIKCRGTFCESECSPFFMPAHEPANASITQCAYCQHTPHHAHGKIEGRVFSLLPALLKGGR